MKQKDKGPGHSGSNPRDQGREVSRRPRENQPRLEHEEGLWEKILWKSEGAQARTHSVMESLETLWRKLLTGENLRI